MWSTGFPKNSKGRGFTLLELLVVLILLGLFGTILFSRVGDFLTDGNLRAAGRTVANEIQRFRAEAAHSRSDRFLGLDLNRNSLYAVDTKGEPLAEVRGVQGAALPPREKSLPTGVRLEDVVVHERGKRQEGLARIRFSPDGTSERALIHLRNTNEDVYTLQLNPLTGAIKVYETYVDERVE